MVCDGIADCPSKEDEQNCLNTSCPGLLRCKVENVCVHPDNICDGVIHCVYSGDDERYCDVGSCLESCMCVNCTLICEGTHVLSLKTLPAYLCSIQIRNSKFALQMEMFANFINLVHVSLSNVILQHNIFHLPKRLFTGTFSLRYLDISRCHLTFIDTNSFSDLIALYILNLGKNKIHTIQTNAFNGLHSLEKLDMSHNKLQFIFECGLCGLHNMQYLNLSNNNLVSLDAGIYPVLRNLFLFDLTGNQIIYMDSYVSDLPNLKHIHLDQPDLCCYLKAPQICVLPVGNQQIKCIGSFYFSNQLLTYAGATCVILIVISACCLTSNPKRFLQNILALLPDMVIALYFMVIYIAINHYFLGPYVYVTEHWTDGIMCYTNGLILISALTMSRFSALNNALNVFIVVKYPFLKRMALLDKYITILFIFQCIVSSGLASLLVVIYHGKSLLCLPWDDADVSVGLIGLCISIFLVLPLSIALVTTLLYYEIICILKESGKTFGHRHTHKHVQQLQQKTVSLLILNVFSSLLLTATTLLNIMDLLKPLNELTNLIALCIQAILNPTMFIIQKYHQTVQK